MFGELSFVEGFFQKDVGGVSMAGAGMYQPCQVLYKRNPK